MPRDGDGLGVSEESAATKYPHFDGLVDILAGMYDGILRKNPSWSRSIGWVDLTAGPGLIALDDGRVLEGTPIIALDAFRARGMPCRATFIEQNPVTADRLRACLQARYGPPRTLPLWYDVVTGDAEQIAPNILRDLGRTRRVGAMVYDPTDIADLDMVARLSRLPEAKYVDIAIYVPATGVKRVRRQPRASDQRTLRERLRQIEKKSWVIREPPPHGRGAAWQWTWLVGSQAPGALFQWKREGFYGWDTPDGQAILDRLDLTRMELAARQQPRLEGF